MKNFIHLLLQNISCEDIFVFIHVGSKESQVKQADVVLLGFPLEVDMPESVRKNDLDMYEKVTTSNGPAMTWSMFCVGYLELNELNSAASMFDKQLLQTTQPYQV